MSSGTPLKLYELKTLGTQDEFSHFVKLVARLMEVEYLSIPVDEKKDT